MRYENLVQNVNRIMADYSMPLTLRQIYYRLVAGGLIPNNRSNYNQGCFRYLSVAGKTRCGKVPGQVLRSPCFCYRLSS